MLYLSQNLKKYRVMKNLTQEELGEYLGITSQSVSKWERGESCPDISFLPALANIFETSVDMLIGMDSIRAESAISSIHKTAAEFQRCDDFNSAEKVYRQALRIYPNNAGMLLGLSGVSALQGKTEEAVALAEKGLPLSDNEKQKSTVRAVLCFLYLQCGEAEKAEELASVLPHERECREVIKPLIMQKPNNDEIDKNIRYLLLGE